MKTIKQRSNKQREARNRQLERDRERLLKIKDLQKPINKILGQLKGRSEDNK